MGKIKQLDYLDSKELLKHRSVIMNQMNAIMDQMLFENREKEIEVINKLVLETAERMKCSVYDVCLTTYPEVNYDYSLGGHFGMGTKHEINGSVELVPIILNLNQGPGYWKNKYYELRRKMQEILDGKEE